MMFLEHPSCRFPPANIPMQGQVMNNTSLNTVFQMFMTEISVGLMNQGALIFIDDILIYSEKWEQHLKSVNEVLKHLGEHDLQAKVGKCHFREKEIRCLGSVVSYKCRKPDPDKVRVMKELQPPKTREDVRSVLGLVGFLS